MSELNPAAEAPKARKTAPPPSLPPMEDDPQPSSATSALTGMAPIGSTSVAPLGINGEIEPAFQPGFERKPFGTMQQKLAATERAGYHRHWFNDPPDRPGRIEEASNAGYTHVRDKSGRPIVRTVGRGGLKAYLMECPTSMWLADMAAQERVNQQTERAIRGGKLSRDPEDDARYVPRNGIRFEDE